MAHQVLVQSLAIVFLALFAFSYHAKSRKQILVTQVFALLFLALHFFLLHAWSGMAMILIHAVMLVVFLLKEKFNLLRNKGVLYLFIIIYVLFTAITWQGFYSVFALLGISSATLAKWQNNPKYIRTMSMPAGVFWILYDAFVLSYGGILMESIILVSIIISLVKNKKSG